ncbi:hypothetical protein FCL51_10780 [Elizabethkingia anophelis]|uniref:hypothetical protein n=1 Tax=Elizabethkingia anophelis TaxID=1117645 RepID=UPI00136536FA|nr:hypothetical protein [Elizabethkingia anophelis]MVW83003.1 hypothetical protein [Elizabethkingia anophelis]UTF99019.1 hypothetical protein J2O04_12160 [Elizabethkingia anophelis]UTG63777.1 hypothetical protein J2O02_11870 [Elizabethkingia anophelis]
MRKDETKQVDNKREYIPPKIEVVTIAMEYGIAASSVAVTPVTTNGSTDPIPTDWSGSGDTTTTNAPF